MKSLGEMLKAISDEADGLVNEADNSSLVDDDDDEVIVDDEEDDAVLPIDAVMNEEYEPDENIDAIENDFDEIVLSTTIPIEKPTKEPKKQGPRESKRFSGIVSSREATIKQKFAVFTRAMSENYKVQWEKVKLATMTHGEVNTVLSREVTAESYLKSKGVVPSA